MKFCENCEAAVTDRFARVFGDENDVPHACRNCADFGALSAGAAAGLPVGGRDHL